MPPEEPPPRRLTVREVADALGVTPRTVQRWVADGRLPATRVGGRLRFAPRDVEHVAPGGVTHGEAAPVVAPGRRGSTTGGAEIRVLLIANRGEIAARIARTARRMGIRTVAIHAPGERPHGHFDEVREVPTYLDGEAIVAAAQAAGADALHPGYGFLAENPVFARRVLDAGLTWVGPPPDAMTAVAEKAEARRRATARGVPVPPGYDGADQADARFAAEAARIGYPLLVKPSAGGGGKGMRVVRDPGELPGALEAARREAMTAFGDDRLILERYLQGARHVEVQLLFDVHGAGVHLGLRDCSAQRRQQKIVEESPAPSVDAALHARMGDAALAVGASVGYANAGTAEFLVGDDGSFYFLEVNARLQVEHPVTELVTGCDLVADQLRIAAGEPLGLSQDEVRYEGHAIEARVYAEDPEHGFLPATGRILELAWPTGDGIRVDAGVDGGDEVTTLYDPLLAKVIAHGADRRAALDRLRTALDATVVLGVRTNLRFLRWLVRQPFFDSGETRTDTLASLVPPVDDEPPDAAWESAAALLLADPAVSRRGDAWGGAWRLNAPPALRVRCGDVERRVELTAPRYRAGTTHHASPRAAASLDASVHVDVDGQSIAFTLAPPPSLEAAARHAAAAGAGAAVLSAPMPGRVISITRREGDPVAIHEPVVVLEAMKMENAVVAPVAGRLSALHVSVGQQVQRGDLLAEITP